MCSHRGRAQARADLPYRGSDRQRSRLASLRPGFRHLGVRRPPASTPGEGDAATAGRDSSRRRGRRVAEWHAIPFAWRPRVTQTSPPILASKNRVAFGRQIRPRRLRRRRSSRHEANGGTLREGDGCRGHHGIHFEEPFFETPQQVVRVRGRCDCHGIVERAPLRRAACSARRHEP
jgi:hypothetical protein